MSVSNIIEVAFGSSTLVFTPPYYKYNSGMYLQFTDLDLPESYQVHFANSVSETSLESIGTSDGVLIPDDVWQTGKTIYAWLYLHPTDDSAVTKYEVRIPVSGRADLPDGTEPSEAEQTTIDTLVTALNTAVSDAEQAKEDAEDARDESATNVTHYPIITDGYWYVWDAESSAYVNTNVKAEGTDGVGITSITKTGTVDLVDTYTVTFTDGTTFDYTVTNGSDGDDGRGITSIAKTSTVDLVDTYTITYTDGTTSTYTVTNGADGDDYVLTSADKEDIARNYSVNVVTVSGTTPTITAQTNTRYVCGEVATLDITVPSSGIIDVVFTSGATATALTVTPPTGMTMKWANGFDPSSLDANTTYELNIMDGLGVACSWT